jgi:hypothetical protein
MVGALTMSSRVSRLAYFGFGLEGIDGEANRAAMLKKVLDWLTVPVDGALARSESAARAGRALGSAWAVGASAAMDEELAERIATEAVRGELSSVRALARRLVDRTDSHTSRVARLVARRLAGQGGDPARKALSELGR